MNTTFAEDAFTPVEESHLVLAIASFLVNIILGVPLNGYVMWLILAGAREKLASDIFSLNLAMAEMFFSSASMWYFLFEYLDLRFYLHMYIFSCGLYYTARPLFLCFMCVECYVGVLHPVLFLRFKPLRYRVAYCCIAWLISLVSCIYSRYTTSKFLYLFGFFIQNVLFFSVMLFCCLSVLWALRRPGPGVTKATEKKKSNATKRRAFKIISLIMISMAINFFLYVFVIPLQFCLVPAAFISALTICKNLALITGFLQPLIFINKTGKLHCF